MAPKRHNPPLVCPECDYTTAFSGVLGAHKRHKHGIQGNSPNGSLASRKRRRRVEFSDTVRERGRHREVMMEFTPYGITVRLKGLRESYEVSPAGVYNQAVRLEVERIRREKKAGKK